MSGIGKRIAKGNSKAHNVLGRIFMADTCLRLYEGDQQTVDLDAPLATYTTDWYLDKAEYPEVTGDQRKYFKRLVVDDLGGCRKEVLRLATIAKVGDALYKFGKKDSLIGSVPTYEFKIYPTGQRV